MPLLVLAVAPDEAGGVTLAEWDALSARQQVLFERHDHPLIERLLAAGVDAGPFDDEPDASDGRRAIVVDPGSVRMVELVRAGALASSAGASSPDPLTSAHGSGIARRAGVSLGGLASVMARLRGADGCPWDQQQTHESLRVHLVEEAYEVLDAIDRGLIDADLEEELGDVLLQVFFHSQLASDDGRFDIATVSDRLVAKLIHRHPHVFGDTAVEGAADVVRNWESIKADEKKRTGPFDDLPAGLPALLFTYKVQKRAAALGFQPRGSEPLERVCDAVEDLASETRPEVLGEALFWFVALARARGIDPEGALRAATTRFRDSF